MAPSFTSFPCPDGVTSLRVVAHEGMPRLLLARLAGSRDAVAIDIVTPAGARVGGFSIETRPTGIYASWDARPAGSGWESVATEPGSAICRLRFADARGQAATSGRGVYQAPRIVRGAPFAVTAIADDQVVLLRRSAAGPFVEKTILRESGLHDAVAVATPGGAVLLHRTYVQGSVEPGPGGQLPYRTTWIYETVQLASLFAVPLDSSFAPAGPATRPLGEALVFQADADVVEGRLLCFATTPRGYLVGETQVETASEWTSPSIVAIGRTAHLAAIATKSDGAREIVVGAV